MMIALRGWIFVSNILVLEVFGICPIEEFSIKHSLSARRRGGGDGLHETELH